MKYIEKSLFLLLLTLCLVSCSSDERPLFDFGEETFDEPFVGFLKSRPELLVKSLDYPPFSWATSDTVSVERTYEISANEDCLRSHSQVQIFFGDSLGRPIKGIDLYANGQLMKDSAFGLQLNSPTETISVRLVLFPSLGDTTINGYVYVAGFELDEVDLINSRDKANKVTLDYEVTAIDRWQCKQEIGWPIMLWLLWLITVLLGIAVLVLVLILIVRYVKRFIHKIKSVTKRTAGIVSNESESQNDKKEEKVSLQTLYMDYPEMENVINEMQQQSPLYYKKENFEVLRKGVRKGKRCYEIRHRRDNGEYSKSAMEICGDEIVAKGGALPGNLNYQSEFNEFLNHPLPNKHYKIDECFDYYTDDKGRTERVKGDINKAVKYLKRRQGDRSNRYKSWVNEKDGNPNDDGGHVIASSFNGPAEKINIVPMNKQWQRPGGEWYGFENTGRSNVIAGKRTFFEIKLLYKGSSGRPYAFDVRMSPKDEFKRMYNPIG